MANSKGNPSSEKNRLLACLPADELRRLQPGLENVTLRFRDILHEPDEPIRHVYFPHGSLITYLVTFADDTNIEVGTVGNEGMTGVPLVLGEGTARLLAWVQVPGDALRIAADKFVEAFERNANLHELLHRYVDVFLRQCQQLQACNRVHRIEQRASRWLLTAADRLGRDTFHLTQKCLSELLGVRRASITEVASGFQDKGLIRYSRGKIHIVNRAGLEARACECYGVIRRETERLLR